MSSYEKIIDNIYDNTKADCIASIITEPRKCPKVRQEIE